MSHQVSASRVVLIGMALVFTVALAASSLIGIFLTKCQKAEFGRGANLTAKTLENIFRIPSSKGNWLLNAINTSGLESDHLSWEEQWEAKTMSLDREHHWVTVKERAIYLIFVQATFKLQTSDGSCGTTVDLQLRLDLRYKEGTEQIASAFHTQHLTGKQQDAYLSLPVLLHMTKGDSLAVWAKPIKRVSFDDVRPFSTFLTIIKYSDWD